MVEIQIAYEGDLHCKATHGPSGATLATDAPKDNQGKGESFSPTDLVATALGTCILTIMGMVAKQRNLDLAGVRVSVEKHMVATPIRRIARLPVNIFVPANPSDEDKQRLINAAYTCPVHKSIHPDIESPVVFHWGAKA